MEDRKRNVQYAEESELSFRAQLWTWRAESISDLRDADDVGISGRPNAGTLLSSVSSRSQKARQPKIVVGPPAFALPSLPLRLDAASS